MSNHLSSLNPPQWFLLPSSEIALPKINDNPLPRKSTIHTSVHTKPLCSICPQNTSPTRATIPTWASRKPWAQLPLQLIFSYFLSTQVARFAHPLHVRFPTVPFFHLSSPAAHSPEVMASFLKLASVLDLSGGHEPTFLAVN